MSANTTAVDCFRCLGQIASYAGRPVGSRYAHRPGACVTRGESESDARKLARQGGQFGQGVMFAATCTQIDEAATSASTALCEFATTSPAAAVDHFRTEHAARPLQPSMRPVKLRKTAAKPKFAPVDLPSIFKTVTWVDKTYSEWQAGTGQVCTETQRRGQFWCAGESAHSIWVIPTPVNGQAQPPVLLYTDKAGRAYANWSEASYARKYGRAA